MVVRTLLALLTAGGQGVAGSNPVVPTVAMLNNSRSETCKACERPGPYRTGSLTFITDGCTVASSGVCLGRTRWPDAMWCVASTRSDWAGQRVLRKALVIAGAAVRSRSGMVLGART
jgi:hypothetical protein